jgi:hypothetical protein
MYHAIVFLPLIGFLIAGLDGDRPAVAEEHHQDGEADRGLRGGDRQHEQGEDLAAV